MLDLRRRLAAEGVGTGLLLLAVVGSGMMGERLAGGNVAIALLANTIATGAVRTDNLISNETGFQRIIPALQRTVGRGA